jgi:CopG family nickel-responsive transcriptional regulator
MSDLVRLSISLDRFLLDRLESLADQAGYQNRSEFVRDLIRKQAVQYEWEQNSIVLATITMLFDHHSRLLPERLMDVQHDYHDMILVSTHVHLDHDLCAEVVMLKGTAERANELVGRLQQLKGVLHVDMTLSSTGESLK